MHMILLVSSETTCIETLILLSHAERIHVETNDTFSIVLTDIYDTFSIIVYDLCR